MRSTNILAIFGLIGCFLATSVVAEMLKTKYHADCPFLALE